MKWNAILTLIPTFINLTSIRIPAVLVFVHQEATVIFVHQEIIVLDAFFFR